MTGRHADKPAETDAARPVARGTATRDIAQPGRPPVRKLVIVTLIVLVGLVGGGATWAALAPLESAAVAPGEVIVESRRKQVKYLKGGSVSAVKVQEGDTVQAGDVLVTFDQTKLKTELAIARSAHRAALAKRARLRAEQRQAETITFPEELRAAAADDPEVADLLATQRELFRSRRQAFRDRLTSSKRHIEELKDEVAALEAQAESAVAQLGFIEEEEAGTQRLFQEGLAQKTRLLALRRTAAQLRGERNNARQKAAAMRNQISRIRATMTQMRSERQESIATDLEAVEQKVGDTRQRLIAARDALEKATVRAPQSGRVVNMAALAAGVSVEPGERLLDIVPQDAPMVVRAELAPADIDLVEAGMPATVSLMAYDRRSVPLIEGTVLRVSADALKQEQGQGRYYAVEIRLDPASIADARERAGLERLEMYPGMPARAMILTGEQTVLAYLGGRFTDMLRTTFREP